METKIISQEKNPFLNREEIVMEVSSEVTPTFDEVKKEIGKDEKLIVMKKINSNFGKKKFIAEAVVYDTIEAKNGVETIPKKIRAKIAEEEKAKLETEKKPAEEVKVAEEKPAEEAPKEEVPVEEKTESSKDDSGEPETKPEEKTE